MTKEQKIIKAQEEYIKLLEKDNAKVSIFAIKNGYEIRQEDVDQGIFLREKVRLAKL